MIIQSSNDPIKIKFPKNLKVTEFTELRVSLWVKMEMIKIWEKEDLEIIEDRNMIIAKLEQEETKDFKEGRCTLEIKWLDKNKTFFAQRVSLLITDRYDKEVMGDE